MVEGMNRGEKFVAGQCFPFEAENFLFGSGLVVF